MQLKVQSNPGFINSAFEGIGHVYVQAFVSQIPSAGRVSVHSRQVDVFVSGSVSIE